MTVPLAYYLIVSGLLFSIGILGVLCRRNTIVIFMSIELMLNAANLSFVAFSHYLHDMSGQLFVFFVMVVAAAEVTVGLAIIVTLYRNWDSIMADHVHLLKG